MREWIQHGGKGFRAREAGEQEVKTCPAAQSQLATTETGVSQRGALRRTKWPAASATVGH